MAINSRSAALIIAGVLFASQAVAQSQPVVGESVTRVSDHVWAIMGFPNIGIVVGSRGVLVVDTGLGPANGATVARVSSKLSSSPKMFLTTTHFHPEHAAGDAGFPAGTILVRNAVQQREMAAHGTEMVDLFRKRSEQNASLLRDVSLREPDIIFNDTLKLDLGGVTASLMWLGEAHTKGDELVFVEPDGTLISGDVIQNKVVPGIFGDGGTPSSWLAVVDKLAKLNVQHVLPDHSPVGDGSLVAAERAFIADVRTRALALKRKGVSGQEAGKQLSADLKATYQDWPNLNVQAFVERIYAESP